MKKVEVGIKFLKDVLFFSNRAGDPFASFISDMKQITVPITELQFGSYVNKFVYEQTFTFLNEYQLREIVNHAIGLSKISGIVNEVHCRLAPFGQDVLIDLGREDFKCVLIDKCGWKILDRPPAGIYFVRPRGMSELPFPESGGNIKLLLDLINFKDPKLEQMFVTQLVSYLNPKGPYPIMMINGGPGTSKTTVTSFVKKILDPSGAPLRSLPKNERDFIISAANSRVLAFDNVSHMTPDLSDICCKLVTGAGFSTRRLFTDGDEKIFNVMIVIIFNGIPDFFSSRSDLADRSTHYTLQPITSDKRVSLDVLEKEFYSRLPKILGVLYSALSYALVHKPYIKLKHRPRMADYAEFVTAVECFFGWELGSTIQLLEQNRLESETIVLENCIYADILFKIINKSAKKNWKGTATELLRRIESENSEVKRSMRQMPQSPSALSASLRRYSAAFASEGLLIDCDGKTNGANSKRYILLEKIKPAKPRTDFLDLEHVDQDSDKKDHQVEKKKCFADKDVFDPESDHCEGCPILLVCAKTIRLRREKLAEDEEFEREVNGENSNGIH
jgi:putative DNA primase/helicase